MTFKQGEEVVIIKNAYKCRNCGRDHGKYYHGDRTSSIRLKSKGKIIRVRSKNKLLVRLNNGRELFLHPDEIDYFGKLAKLKSTLPGIQDIPRHPIFEIAEQSPIFLIDGTAYSVGDRVLKRQADKKDHFRKRVNRGYSRKELVEVGDFNSLEGIALDRAELDMEGIRKTYAGSVQKKLKSLMKLDKDLDLSQLIFKQVFPYLMEEGYQDKVSELLGGEKRKKAAANPQKNAKVSQRLEQIADETGIEIDKLIKQINEEDKEPVKRSKKQLDLDVLLGYKAPGPYEGSSLLGKALDGANVAIIDGAVYNLVAGADGSEKQVQIGDKIFSVTEAKRGSSEIENRFLTELGKKIRIDALEEHLSRDKIIDLLSTQDVELLAMAGKREYDGEGFGFVQKGGACYAYLEVPAFAIRSQFDDNYYLFEKSRVGIKVWRERGQLGYDTGNGWDKSGLVAIDNNNHPFLHNKTYNFAHFCTGRQSFPTSGKHNGEVIAKRLRRCREMLMFGYTNTDYRDSYKLRSNGYFTQNKTTLSKLKKLGVPIIRGGRRE